MNDGESVWAVMCDDKVQMLYTNEQAASKHAQSMNDRRGDARTGVVGWAVYDDFDINRTN